MKSVNFLHQVNVFSTGAFQIAIYSSLCATRKQYSFVHDRVCFGEGGGEAPMTESSCVGAFCTTFWPKFSSSEVHLHYSTAALKQSAPSTLLVNSDPYSHGM